MKAWNCKRVLYVLLCSCIGLGYAMTGCSSDDGGDFDADYGNNKSSGINTQAEISDFAAHTWSGEMTGLLGGMSGTMTVALDNPGGMVLEGIGIDISDAVHVPTDFDMVGTVGAVDAGIYTFTLRMNDTPGSTDPCIGWNVIGVATLNAANDVMDVSCVGIFCAAGTGGALGISVGSLDRAD